MPCVASWSRNRGREQKGGDNEREQLAPAQIADEDGPDEVKLLLDGQGPQHAVLLRPRPDQAGHVRDVEERRDDEAGRDEVAQLERREQEHVGGQDAQGSPDVEVLPVAGAVDRVEQNAGDEEARQREEDDHHGTAEQGQAEEVLGGAAGSGLVGGVVEAVGQDDGEHARAAQSVEGQDQPSVFEFYGRVCGRVLGQARRFSGEDGSTPLGARKRLSSGRFLARQPPGAGLSERAIARQTPLC